MGGLVIEDYIRQFGSNNIKTWIPVAAPFKGAAGNALRGFLTGL